jgi:hypothetical protein
MLEMFLISIPIACASRTVIFEEIFREARDWCKGRSQICRRWYERKFFYLFTCEYCFSHYVTAFFLVVTRFKLIFDDWRGYLLSFFSLVFIANILLNFYGRLRVEIHKEKAEIQSIESGSAQTPAADGSKTKGKDRSGNM